MAQSFSTSVGTIEVVVHEASRIVSLSRLGEDGRPVASRMCDWDSSDLTQVLTEITVPFGEAKQIADEVKAEHAALTRAFPQPVQAAHAYQAGYASRPAQALENAGIALRFVAVLLDGIIVFFPLGFIYGYLTAVTQPRLVTSSSSGASLSGKETLLFAVVGIGYYILAEAVYGQTVGKKIVGIRVVDEDGDHVGLGAAVVRNLLRIVDSLFFYLIGALFAYMSPKGQRIGDRAAHTLVVRR